MLYQAINIWRKIDSNTAVNYVCLMCVSSKKFSVQNSDFYRLPFDAKQIAEFRAQFIELFAREFHPIEVVNSIH